MNNKPNGEPWLEPEYTESGNGNRYLFGGKERIFAGRINEYDFHARSYLASQCRFSSIDPLAGKTPWLSPYTFCASNPVNFTDPDGRKLFAVHGTNSNNGTWEDQEGIFRFCMTTFKDTLYDFKFYWSGGNYASSRRSAAIELINYINKKSKGLPDGEPITIVGHSHGGNVGIEAINMMVEMAEFDGIQINLLTINTPVREDYQLSEKARNRVKHINVYDPEDPVQTAGGNNRFLIDVDYYPELLINDFIIGEYGQAGRIFNNAYRNISVDNPQPFIKWYGPIPWFGDYHNSHNRVPDWENK